MKRKLKRLRIGTRVNICSQVLPSVKGTATVAEVSCEKDGEGYHYCYRLGKIKNGENINLLKEKNGIWVNDLEVKPVKRGKKR